MPIHISKPYWNGQALLLNVMSPTAGLLEGDHVELDILVEPGSTIALSNPTALRIHKMSTGKATWNQTFRIAKDAFLETHPEWLIPQAQSRFEQRTRIELEKDAQLFFIETLAAGRVASGESFSFSSFRNRLELRYDRNLSALEKFDISPENKTHTGWTAAFENSFYISIYAVSPKLKNASPLFQAIHDIQTESLFCGSSQLSHGPCWNIKILSPYAVEAKAALTKIRELFYQAIGLRIIDLRR
ncbi:MAG: urease accessory protein UreD [Opitutales bacterium]|nr:urease accessory protein UreD [Opitutales bacterium]MBT5813174.1 urease accessory protein UreD [Opitutales bacterium]MDG2256617.1 urease accessory protein UreD [Opitutaceae bacterium]